MAGLGNFVPASRPAWGLQAAAAAAPPSARRSPLPAALACALAPPREMEPLAPWAAVLGTATRSGPRVSSPPVLLSPVPTQCFQNVSLREAPRWDVGLQGCCCCFSKNESARSVVTGL